MKNAHFARFMTVVLALFLATAAAPARADDKDAALKRMKDRLPALQQAKAAGTVGEVWNGYIETVKSESMNNAETANLVNEENADRKALYAAVAAAQGATADAVAQTYAKGFFDHARKGDFLKGRDNVWRQKQ